MSQHKPYTFIFFGIAGSGKGTQVELLEKYLNQSTPDQNFVFASPGNEYRKIVSSGNYTGNFVKHVMEQGTLLPDFLTISLVTNSIATKITEDACLIADGYPRTIDQAVALEKTLDFYQRGGADVVYIEVSKEEAMKRMKLRARSDDTDASIEKRFDEYVNNVLPAMNYFKDKPSYNVYTINGEQAIELVHDDIIKSLAI